jgi:hypothetical protein
MKKLFLSAAVVAALSFSLSSCKKVKDAVNCVETAQKYADASSAYVADPTKANCDAFKAAITEYKNASCTPAEMKATLESEFSSLNCQ